MNAVVWVDGALRGATEPVISALNHGFTVGDGVFETLAVNNGTPFALTRHLMRLRYSADRIGLGGIDVSKVQDGVAAVLEAGRGGLTRLRITATSGAGPMSSMRGPGEPTIVVTGGTGAVPRSCVAVRAPWKRNERSPIAGVKTTSYAENVVMIHYAESKGADEAIVSNTHGHLCEGTATNIFVERAGEIVTPPLASGCLPGITRGLALEWGARSGIPVRVAAPGELEMAILDLVVAGEAHAAVTSSTRGVQAITRLDGTPVSPGKLLTRLADVYDESAAADPDPEPPRQK
jgi:branched-chain amino acid aminotransferase